MRLQLALTAALVAIPFASRASETFLNYPQALATAKSRGSDLILFVDWPNRAPDSAAMRRVFSSPAVRKLFGETIVWGVFEYTESTAAVPSEKKPAKGEEPEFVSWNLPAVQIIDPDGRVFAVAEGLRADSVRSVVLKIPSLLDARGKRDVLWTKARAAAGVERANLFGAGLDLMPQEHAETRKDIIDEIRKADPQDSSGYTFKYTFDPSAFHERIADKLLGENKSDELLALIAERMRNPHLTSRQRQGLLTARFQAMLRVKRLPEAFETLRQITKLNPTNDMGRGAEQFLKYYTEPVRLEGREWSSGDNRPVWLPMVVNVSDVVKLPGIYEIEFKHKAGNTRFAKTELIAGREILASNSNEKCDRKLRLEVMASPKGPVELRADALGSGWFDGAGEILVRKVD